MQTYLPISLQSRHRQEIQIINILDSLYMTTQSDLTDKNEIALQHSAEIRDGDRFGFGANWSQFLQVLDEDRILQAENSLRKMLEVDNLIGKTFLDIGSGSGLFSLAARRLGASVRSFDYDPQSVACTNELKQRYFQHDSQWQVESASVLDQDFLTQLGTFDIVYSWGVLHHTGAMWQALDNVAPLVAKDGRLFIAIYNDQGGWSRRWTLLKRTYNKLPGFLKLPYTILVMGPRELRSLLLSCLSGKPGAYINNIVTYSKQSARGMNYWYDLIDWIGGYPFEVAKPEEIFDFYKQKGFTLAQLKTDGGNIGCLQFVFVKH